jgi:branched-chain amino acid transport system permease protein
MALSGNLAFLVSMLTLGSIYAILAIGLNIQWGQTGLFNISVAAFWGIGAYTAALVTKVGGETAFSWGLPYLWIDVLGFPLPIPVAVILAAIVSGVVAVLIGIPTLRLRTDYLAIATLGLAETIRLVFLNEAWLTGGGTGSTVANPLIDLEYANLTLLAVTLVVLGIVYWLAETGARSPWGRALEAIRDDEDVAQALGKNTFSMKMQAFVIGSMIMGVAGALTALRLNFLTPFEFIPEFTFYVWIAVIVGGSGSNRGAILGAGFLMVLLQGPRFLSNVLPSLSGSMAADLRFLLIGLVLMIVVTYRPQGFLGDKQLMTEDNT